MGPITLKLLPPKIEAIKPDQIAAITPRVGLAPEAIERDTANG